MTDKATHHYLPDSLRRRLVQLLGEEGVRVDSARRLVYARDGMPIVPQFPMAVLSPSRFDQVPHIVRMLHEERIPFVPRGAGTGLSGGAVPMAGSVVLNMARLRRIHAIDPRRRMAVVEPGVVNVTLSKEAARYGLEFAPDPSSESTSTIGGNVAENAGGPHTLKKGVTRPHVLGLEVVRPDGRTIILPWGVERLEEILPLPPEDLPGPDLLSLMTGGEGTLGVVTRIVCRLTPLPEARETLVGFFTDGDDAVSSVTDLLASGFIPAAVEMIDEVALHTVAEAFSLSVPDEAKVFLLVEVDGLAEEVKFQARRVEEIFRDRRALETRRAEGEEEREVLWAARKKAVGALGRIAPSYYVHDGVVPRSRMGEVLEEVRRLSDEHGLRTANIFHAGDGNLHPIILFDEADPDESQRAMSLGEEILKLCVRVGGTLTGEHGIGREKRHLMSHLFSEMQIDVMSRIRDLFNPDGLLNPEKIIPLPVGCLEGGRGSRPATGDRSWRDIVLESRDGGRQDRPRSMILSSYEEEEPAPEKVQKLCASVLDPEAVARIIEGIPALDLADPIVEVQPEDVESVDRILNLTHREGWHVLPRGGATQLTQAGPVSRVDVVLDLSSLSRVHDISSDDLIVEADAGIRLHELNEALEPHGLWVPLDAPDPHHSTLGGVLATSYTGLRTGSWGSGRFRVLALESCSPGLGRQLWGRGVTKNVAGYDVARLMVGSMGTLGVFTRAILRADPRPRRWRTAILSGPTSALVSLAGALVESFRSWSHLELLASTGDSPDDAWWPKGAGLALLVGCDGTDEVSRQLEKEVMSLLDENGLDDIHLDWCSTEELLASVQLWCSGFSGETAFRCHTDPLAAPGAFANLLEQNPSRIQLHLKTGVLRTVWQESLPSREDLGRILGVKAWGVPERASRAIWRSFLGKDVPKTVEVESLAELKRILDPSGLLRPLTMLPVRFLHDDATHDANEDRRVSEVSP